MDSQQLHVRTSSKRSSQIFNKVNTSLLQLSERNKYFSKWLDNTAINGIVHVFKEKSLIRRVIWGLVFLAATAYCLYSIVERGSYFASNPSATKLTVSAKDSIPFPAVTICNCNPIKRSLAVQLNITKLLKLYYLSNIFYSTEQDRLPSDSLTHDLCKSYLTEIDNSTLSMTLRDLYRNGAINSSEMIQQCFFGQGFTACKNMFKPVFTTASLCYSINSNQTTLHSTARGVLAGLNVYNNIHQDSQYIAPFASTAGMKVLIHSKGIVPDPEQRGVAILPGRSAFISLTKLTIDDQTGNECVYSKSNKIFKYFPNYNYSVSSCYAEIYASTIVQRCNCLLPFVTANISDISQCTIAELCCITQSFRVINISSSSCMPSCQRTEYTTSVSYVQFPDSSNIENFQQFYNLTSEQIRSDFLTLHIYFESLTVTSIVTTYLYSFTAFLSDVGGQLGLFIGASVISILEIGILLLDLSIYICKSCRRTKSLEVDIAKDTDDDDRVD